MCVSKSLPHDEEPALLPITRDALHEALQRSTRVDGSGQNQPLPANTVEDLWEMLDANGDGVLTPDELMLGEEQARLQPEKPRLGKGRKTWERPQRQQLQRGEKE